VDQARIANLAKAPTEIELLSNMLKVPHQDLPQQAQTLLLANAQKLWRVTGDRAAMPERIFTVHNPNKTHKFHIDPTCSHLPEPPEVKLALLTMNRCEVCLKRERKKHEQQKTE
jgi:hypothetical protein